MYDPQGEYTCSTMDDVDDITFDGSESGLQPMCFLRKIDEICYNEDNLYFFGSYLKGDAREWFLKNEFMSYAEAQTAFIDEFWGDVVQNQICEQIYGGRYTKSMNISRASYVRGLVQKARYLDPPIPMVVFLNVLRKHFVADVMYELIPTNLDSIDDFIKILEDIEYSTRTQNASMQNRRSFSDDSNGWDAIKDISDNISRILGNLYLPGIGRIEDYQYDIELDCAKPFYPRSYPIPKQYFKLIQDYLDYLEEEGVVRKAITEYINPLVVILKNNGSVRLCLDASELNTLIKDEEAKPLTKDQVLQRIGRCTIFSTLNFADALWQIPLSPQSQELTGFHFDNQTYVFCRMPFGLKTGTSVLTRAIAEILGPNLSNQVIIYDDDILIADTDHDRHCEILWQVLNKLEGAGVKLNKDKCLLYRPEINFLRHTTIKRGISISKKIKYQIDAFPCPVEHEDLKVFLDLINANSRFIPNLSELSGPLELLLKNRNEFQWTGEVEESFLWIKNAFQNAKELSFAVEGLNYGVEVDVLNHSIGVRLFQYFSKDIDTIQSFDQPSTSTNTCGNDTHVLLLVEKEVTKEFVISYASKRLSNAEAEYTVGECEILALVWALEKWYTILVDEKVLVRSYYHPMRFLKSSTSHNTRIAQWLEYLGNFNMVHIDRKSNRFLDGLI